MFKDINLAWIVDVSDTEWEIKNSVVSKWEG
jgi:hypothetical protein